MTISNQLKIGVLGLVVSALALIFIVTQLQLDQFISAWAAADYRYVIPCIVLLFLGLVTRAIRWRILLDNQLSLQHTFNIMNVAYLVNGVLPLRIGELARVYLVSRTRKAIPMLKTTSTIIVERLLDLLAVGMMVLLALVLAPVPQQIRLASAVGATLAVVGFFILILLAKNSEWTQRQFASMLRRIPLLNRLTVLETGFGHFLDGLQPITRWRPLFNASFWTAISWLLSVLSGYALMFAFFEETSIAAATLYIAAVALAIALPAVPGNIGTYEASILLALIAVGYEQSSTTIAFAVMVHAVNVLLQAVMGVIGFIQEGISLAQLSQGVQNMKQSTETEHNEQ